MASGNQGQGRGNEGHDPRNGGVGQSSRNAGQNPQGAQGTQGVTDRFREGYDAAREEMAHRYRRAEGAIARNPGNSVLIGFGLGVGIGLALTAMLTHHEEESWADRHLPDSLRDLPDTIAKSRLAGRVRDVHVPDSVHHTYHHIAETLRDLPSAIAKALGR